MDAIKGEKIKTIIREKPFIEDILTKNDMRKLFDILDNNERSLFSQILLDIDLDPTNNLVQLQDGMFFDIHDINNLEICETVTMVCKGAFSYCGFKKIIFKSKFLYLENNCFHGFDNQAIVMVPKDCKIICESNFDDSALITIGRY